MKSMTAFASDSVVLAGHTLTWEIRSVNHRYLDCFVRLPESARSLDTDARALIKKRVARGKVEAQLNIVADHSQTVQINLNQPLISALVGASQEIDAISDQNSPVSALQLLRWPGVVLDEKLDVSQIATAAIELLDKTLDKLKTARAIEGEVLKGILTEKLGLMATELTKLEGHAPKMIGNLRQKLLDRFEALSLEVDPQRLEHEIVFLAQKLDVDEEIDRLKAHVTEVGRVLAEKGAIGRRLDFLMQELNREANTLTSKSTDKEATAIAVEMKVLIEQMREQVQNVE